MKDSMESRTVKPPNQLPNTLGSEASEIATNLATIHLRVYYTVTTATRSLQYLSLCAWKDHFLQP